MRNPNPTWQDINDAIEEYEKGENCYQSKSMWENIKDYVKDYVPDGNIKGAMFCNPGSDSKATPKGKWESFLSFLKLPKKKLYKLLKKAAFVVGMVGVGALILGVVSPATVSIPIIILLGLVSCIPLYYW